MNKTIILFLLPVLMSFQTDEKPVDGRYLLQGAVKDLVYAVEISNGNSDIKFYMNENENDTIADWKIFATGKIVMVKNEYFIQNIITKNVPYKKDMKLEMKIKDGNIVQFKTFNLFASLYGRFTQWTDWQKFKLEQPKP